MMPRRALSPMPAVFAVIAVIAVTTLAIVLIAGRAGDEGAPRAHGDAAAVPALPDDLDTLDPAVADFLRDARAAVVATPGAADAWMQYALALHANEQFRRAAAAYTEVVRLDPERARAWYMLARVATRLGRVEEALAAFDAAATHDGRYAPAFWRAGLLLLDLGRPADALSRFDRAVSIDGPLSTGALGRARAWLALGRPGEVIASLEAYTESDAPNAGYARNLLAAAYRQSGRLDEAGRVAAASGDAAPVWPDPWEQTLAAHRPGYGARIAEARALIAAGRPAEAIAKLEALRRDFPDNATVLSNLGLAYRQAGRFDESVAALREALTRDDAFFLAHFHLAVAYAQGSGAAAPPAPAAELRERARAHLDRVLALNSAYAPAYSLRGDLARLDGDAVEALRDYRAAAQRDPQDARFPFRAGVTLVELERWEEAARALERAATLEPRDAETRRALATAAMGLGRLDDAGRELREAERLAPGDERVRATRRRLDAMRAAAGEEREP